MIGWDNRDTETDRTPLLQRQLRRFQPTDKVGWLSIALAVCCVALFIWMLALIAAPMDGGGQP